MKKKEIIEIIEEVVWVFSDWIRKELWYWKSLDSTWVGILLNWVKEWLYKKIAIHDEER